LESKTGNIMNKTLIATTVAMASAVFLTACGSPPQQAAAPYYPASQTGYQSSFGFIESIQVVAANRSTGPGVGAVVGGVVGGILGNQVGGGTGKDVATVVGVVGGAVVGNKIEQSNRVATRDVYQISVRLDNGTYQSVQQESLDGMQVGNRVRIENGHVYRN
jgi:outer membrane lipoprotein SlyB